MGLVAAPFRMHHFRAAASVIPSSPNELKILRGKLQKPESLPDFHPMKGFELHLFSTSLYFYRKMNNNSSQLSLKLQTQG
jgi:hypothetical protein